MSYIDPTLRAPLATVADILTRREIARLPEHRGLNDRLTMKKLTTLGVRPVSGEGKPHRPWRYDRAAVLAGIAELQRDKAARRARRNARIAEGMRWRWTQPGQREKMRAAMREGWAQRRAERAARP